MTPLLLAQAVPDQPLVLTSTFQHSSFSPALAYDPHRDRIVVATEHDDGTLLEWDGSAWARMAARPPYTTFQMVYDPSRQRVLMIQAPWVVGRGLHEYDGHSVRSLGQAPPFTAMAFDSLRNRLVGVGYGRTWEWDGATWTERAIGTSPPTTTPMSLAFDPVRGRMVTYVFGTGLGSTWEWDGANWTIAPANAPAAEGQLAFDPSSNAVICVAASGYVQGWTGTGWVPYPYAGPGVEGYCLLATDPTRSLVYLFNRSSRLRHRIQALGTLGWTDACESPHPERNTTEPTYDLQRRRLVLFGGQDHYAVPKDDLFEFDGARWIDRSASSPRPAARMRHAQVYDPRSGETLVLGGAGANGTLLDDCWAWNGSSWRLLPMRLPTPRKGAAAAVDTVNNRLVVLGGRDATGLRNDHHEWDGTSWSALPASPFAPHEVGALGFDPVRGLLVFQPIPTSAALVPTMIWNGQTWVAGPTDGPHCLARSLAFDWQNLGLVCVSHPHWMVGFGKLRWHFDGITWSQSPVTVPLINDLSEAVVHDPDHGRLVFYGNRTMHTIAAQPAAVSDYGSGCGVAGRTATLSSFGKPRLDNPDYQLDVRAGAGAGPAMLALGFAPGSIALGNGCTLLLTAAVASTLALPNPQGFVSIAFPLPWDNSLAGLQLFAQAGALDAASVGGFVLSQGLALTLGN